MPDDSAAAWLLDLDGTLYDPRPVKLFMAAELALGGWGVIPTVRAFRRAHETLRQNEAPSGGMPFERQIEIAATELGTDRGSVERVVRRWMIERPGKWLRIFRRRSLLEEIAKFRAAGGRTAVVSDYPARSKLEAMGVASLFEIVIACGEEAGPSCLKPSPEGYLAAARALGVSPDRCLVIGDRDDADGEAARAAGMRFRRVR